LNSSLSLELASVAIARGHKTLTGESLLTNLLCWSGGRKYSCERLLENGNSRSADSIALAIDTINTELLHRADVMNSLLSHAETVFLQNPGCPYMKWPMCIEFGASGSGKTEIFRRLLLQYEMLVEDYTNSPARKRLFAGIGATAPPSSLLMPSECLVLVVSFNCKCTYSQLEDNLLKKMSGNELEAAIALRLMFQWLWRGEIYSEFLEHVPQVDEDVASLGLHSVVAAILQITGKKRALLCVDEIMLFIDFLQSRASGAVTNCFLYVQALTNAQSSSLAIVYSTADMKVFDDELIRRSVSILLLPLLPYGEVAEKIFDVILRRDEYLDSLCGSRQRLLRACARLSGGYPRAIKTISKVVNETIGCSNCGEIVTRATTELQGGQRVSDISATTILMAMSPQYKLLLGDTVGELIRKGLFHSDRDHQVFMPHIVMLQFLNQNEYSVLPEAERVLYDFVRGMLGVLEKPEGKAWEEFIAFLECLRPYMLKLEVDRKVNRLNWRLVSLAQLYDIPDDEQQGEMALVFTLTNTLRSYLFDWTFVRTIRRFDADTNFRDLSINVLLSHIWIPKNRSNPGFDVLMFLQPLTTKGTPSSKRPIALLTDCKYSCKWFLGTGLKGIIRNDVTFR
jgi:hypothetical protein